MKKIKMRTKIEASVIALLLFAISVSATVTITNTSLTTDDSDFRLAFDGNWANLNNITIDNISAGNVTVSGNYYGGAIYACLSDSTDQTFAETGIGYNITFNTNDEISGITHSTVSEPQNITIVTSGVYTIIAQPQVHADPGASGTFHMWLRRDTGSGFADVANTNVELVLASNGEDVIPLIITMALSTGDVIRVNASVSHTGIELDAQTPAGEPAIPSIIFSIYRIGS